MESRTEDLLPRDELHIAKENDDQMLKSNDGKTTGRLSTDMTPTFEEQVSSMYDLLEGFHNFMEGSEAFESEVLTEAMAIAEEIKMTNSILDSKQKRTINDINSLANLKQLNQLH